MKIILILFILGLLLLFTSCLTLPTPTITRTHLMKDIDKQSVTIGAGIEFELEENPGYWGDSFFGYVGYAPLDWLEIGIAGHSVALSIYPSLEAKIDVINMFTDCSPFSCVLMGGIGGLPEDLFFAHAGLAMNFRINQSLQLYLGAGTDSISDALNLQAGAYIAPIEWLGVSSNVKFVKGNEGTDLMFSIAPLITLYLGGREGLHE